MEHQKIGGIYNTLSMLEVYDPIGMQWVFMQQPLLKTDTLTVTFTSPTVNQGTGGSSVWLVKQNLITAPVSGQLKMSVTGTARNLPAGTLLNGVVLKSDVNNVAAITVGGSGVTNTADGTGNGTVLQPGDALPFAVDDLSRLWINGTANDWVSWAAS